MMNQHEENSDQNELALLMTGDRNAFERIYKKYASELYRYARKNISSKEDCEEIIQEIFESLWRRRAELGHVIALRAYMFQMVKYKIIRYCRNNLMKKRYAEHYGFFEAVYDTLPASDHDPSSVGDMIEKGLMNLPTRCQQAMRLRLHENLSNGDIAKRMNITKKTVEAYMLRAFDHFRKIRQEFLNVS